MIHAAIAPFTFKVKGSTLATLSLIAAFLCYIAASAETFGNDIIKVLKSITDRWDSSVNLTVLVDKLMTVWSPLVLLVADVSSSPVVGSLSDPQRFFLVGNAGDNCSIGRALATCCRFILVEVILSLQRFQIITLQESN
jgi:hypothetical protein